MIVIIWKLAKHGGSNEDGKIKTSNGDTFDLVPLLLHASSPGKNVKGIPEFVNLLYQSGVTPDLIINSYIREELKKRISTYSATHNASRSTSISNELQYDTSTASSKHMSTPETKDGSGVNSSKRKRQDSSDNEQLSKKFQFDWDQSDSDLDEH